MVITDTAKNTDNCSYKKYRNSALTFAVYIYNFFLYIHYSYWSAVDKRLSTI